MKIKCDQCGAKYQVADEKVRHKVFKIRCKRCENAIIVRADENVEERTVAVDAVDGAAPIGDEEATRQIQHGSDAAVDENAVWHIVVDRQQVGPLTPQEITGYLGRGEVTGDAFIWRDGLGDWQKMSAVDDFVHLFSDTVGADDLAAAKDEEEPPVSEAPQDQWAPDEPAVEEPSTAQEPNEGPVFPDQGGDEDLVMSNPAAEEPAGLFGHVDDMAAEEARVTSGDQLREQRNDNSVLFSLDALDAGLNMPSVANTGGTEGSGLIDISLLGNSGGGEQMDGIFDAGNPAGGLGAVSAPQQMPSLVARRRSNTGLWVAMGVGALLLSGAVGTAVYFASRTVPAPAPVPATAGAPKAKVLKIGQSNKTAKSTAPSTKTATGKAQIAGAVAVPAPKPAANAAAGAAGPTGGTSPKTPEAAADKQATGANGTPTPANPAVAAVAAQETAKQPPVAPRTPKASAKKNKAKRLNAKQRWAKLQKIRKERNRAKARKTKARAAAAKSSPAKVKPIALPKERPAPKKKKSRGGDEVDDLLSNLNGSGGKKSTRKSAPRGRSRAAAPAAPSVDPLLPEKLGRRQIISVVTRNTKKILSCKSKQADLRGIVKVSIRISGSTGRVSRADIKTPKFQGTSVGRCVSAQIKNSFRFPQFRGASMAVTIPFRL